MGKESLIKSTTSKKGAAAKSKSPVKGKTAAKGQAAKPKVKVQSKTKTAVKTKAKAGSKPKAKTVAKGKAVAARKKPGAVKKKVTLRQLLQKQFPRWQPERLWQPPTSSSPGVPISSPAPFGDRSEAEKKRIRSLMLKKFDLQAAAAAVVSDPVPAVQKPTTAPEPEVSPATPSETPATETTTPSEAQADEPAVMPPPAESAQVTTEAAYELPPTQDSFSDMKGSDPMDKTTKILIMAVAVMILLVIGASMANQKNYYLKAADGAVEVWQGTFAPKGMQRLVILPGAQATETLKSAYTKGEVFPLVFDYYLQKADTLLEVAGIPDFEGIKAQLTRAREFAGSDEALRTVTTRLNAIEMMLLTYKADIAVTRGEIGDVKAALGYLYQARELELIGSQNDMINAKIKATRELLDKLKARAAKKASKAVEKAAE